MIVVVPRISFRSGDQTLNASHFRQIDRAFPVHVFWGVISLRVNLFCGLQDAGLLAFGLISGHSSQGFCRAGSMAGFRSGFEDPEPRLHLEVIVWSKPDECSPIFAVKPKWEGIVN